MGAKEAYLGFCGEMASNFDRDWEKISSQIDSGYPHLERIPERAWKELVAIAIRTWNSWPKNWVKNVEEVYAEWWRSQAIPPLTQYDPVEDYRFPVQLLHKGLQVFQDRGPEAFNAFAGAVGMPRNDRDRVRCKARVMDAQR